jgi:hypothetical protein
MKTYSLNAPGELELLIHGPIPAVGQSRASIKIKLLCTSLNMVLNMGPSGYLWTMDAAQVDTQV